MEKIKELNKIWQKLKEWALYLCYFELVNKMEELEIEFKKKEKKNVNNS